MNNSPDSNDVEKKSSLPKYLDVFSIVLGAIALCCILLRFSLGFLMFYYVYYYGDVSRFLLYNLSYRDIDSYIANVSLIFGILGLLISYVSKRIQNKNNVNGAIQTKALNFNLIVVGITFLVIAVISAYNPFKYYAGKPVIYLYPQSKEDVLVNLDFKGTLQTTYPLYDYQIKGWKVTAYPDGRLINIADNKEYSYLFWDGEMSAAKFDMSKGFVVEGKNTRGFLQDTLAKMGLTPREYNEFIVYWLPHMESNKYNLIHFADKEYTDVAALKITPKPDSLLRVFMVYKGLLSNKKVEPQELPSFERKGFSVVEWGGACIDN